MKKLGLIVLCLAVVALIGCSKGTQEVEASYGGCDGYFAKFINDCDPHPDQPKGKMKVGVGADIPLIIHEQINVDQETRFNLNVDDFGKDDISTMTVFKPQLEEGILQTAWGFLSKLNPFNRD